MNANNTSTNRSKLWFMKEKPIFERTYGTIENAVSVEKTEHLTSNEIEDIVGELAESDQFLSIARQYIERMKSSTNPLSRTEDASLYSELTARIDASLANKNLEMRYFFSNSIAIEILQRIVSGELEDNK